MSKYWIHSEVYLLVLFSSRIFHVMQYNHGNRFLIPYNFIDIWSRRRFFSWSERNSNIFLECIVFGTHRENEIFVSFWIERNMIELMILFSFWAKRNSALFLIKRKFLVRLYSFKVKMFLYLVLLLVVAWFTCYQGWYMCLWLMVCVLVLLYTHLIDV